MVSYCLCYVKKGVVRNVAPTIDYILAAKLLKLWIRAKSRFHESFDFEITYLTGIIDNKFVGSFMGN